MPTEPQSTRLFVLRHGEVSAEWGQRIYGRLDVPLSERGREQSRAAAEALGRLPLGAVVSSGLQRAEYAAGLLRGHLGQPERHDDPRLLEIDRGDWAGLGREELEARSPGAWQAFWSSGGLLPVPAGESLADVSARVLPALDDWAARGYGTGGVAVVAHKWVLRVALCAAAGLAPEASARFEVGHTGLAVLDWPLRESARAADPAPGRRAAVLVALIGRPGPISLDALAEPA